MTIPTAAAERFMAKIRIEDGHWRFITSPRGWFRLGPEHACERTQANRASWILFRGAIPDGANVRHCAEHLWCVRPEHLSLGTNSDVLARTRESNSAKHRGELNSRAKLTDSQAIEIRQLYDEGWLARQLAARFSVCRAAIHHIVRGRSYGHLPLGRRGLVDNLRKTPRAPLPPGWRRR